MAVRSWTGGGGFRSGADKEKEAGAQPDHQARRDVDTESFSWPKAAAVGIFLPMVINLLVLVTYLVTAP